MNRKRKPLFDLVWKKWHVAGAAVLVVSLLTAGILSVVMKHETTKLTDQNLVSRWSNQNDYAQVSVFFPYGTLLEEGDIKSFDYQFNKALTDISRFPENDSQRLFVYCFYETGSVTIAREKTSLQVDAIGVSEDFFLFHPMNFVSGGPIPTGTDLTDYVVLDEKTAWNLFGAIDVEGMEVRIGGIPHVISGVIKTADDKLSVAGGSKENLIYLTQASLKQYGTQNTTLAYELLMPEPYEGYALDTLQKAFSTYEKTGVFLDNTKRFGWKHLWGVFKERNQRSMQTKPIVYPYWENVARFYENKFVRVRMIQIVCLVIAGLLLLAEIISVWKMRTFDKEDIRNGCIYMMEALREKRKKRNNFEEDEKDEEI